MRAFTLVAAAVAAALLTGAAPAEEPSAARDTRTICLDARGDIAVQSCRVLPGRLNRGNDDCRCPRASIEVKVSVCGPGERPQTPSEAFRQTRLVASRDGSLVGDSFEGREICSERASRR